MREFGKLLPQFWIGATGRKIHQAGPEATVIACYVISSPHANMLGLYYLPKLYMAHETGLGVEGASKGLQRAIDAGFCHYDSESEVVFIPEMAKYQIGEQLLPTDKRCLWVQKQYDALPENPFLRSFYEKYAKAFNLKKARGKLNQIAVSSQAPSMPLRSQENENETEN